MSCRECLSGTTNTLKLPREKDGVMFLFYVMNYNNIEVVIRLANTLRPAGFVKLRGDSLKGLWLLVLSHFFGNDCSS